VPEVGLRDAKVEDLEKALEARRKADPAAAEKWRLEEEAQRKAAEQKAQADAAARQAAIEEARRKVEAEAAVRRKAEDEAWRKALAEAETALRRQVEEDARRKAIADAEAKRQADEALAKAQAERQRADEDAQRKAQAEASAKVDADARKAGELAENGLRLTVADRQRLQVALTSLGFDTRGYDGAFGPRTRDMIANWQKARNLPPTGFLTASQRQALLREAAAALTKYDDEQKKFEDDRRKADEARRRAEEEARATSSAPADAPMALPPAPPAPPPFVAAPGSSFDGTYRGSLMVSITSVSSLTASLELRNGRLAGSLLDARCGTYGFAATVSPSGEISGTLTFMTDQICSPGQATVTGRVFGSQLQLDIRVGPLSATGSLVRSGG
jgi:Putative peptidoglycan binding domain